MATRRPGGPLPMGNGTPGYKAVRAGAPGFRALRRMDMPQGSSAVPEGVFPTAAGRLGRRAFVPGIGPRSRVYTSQPVRGHVGSMFATQRVPVADSGMRHAGKFGGFGTPPEWARRKAKSSNPWALPKQGRPTFDARRV